MNKESWSAKLVSVFIRKSLNVTSIGAAVEVVSLLMSNDFSLWLIAKLFAIITVFY